MKKSQKKPKRITLHRETLRCLDQPGLIEVIGGATNQRSACQGTCHNTCPNTGC
ncbi:MAG TPA: hypothetical protein VMM92_10755 [Thermoanaerobaculia bacterium]|nr:hypothetical protein [Thermoanaerobaculia bacterium]